MASTERIYWRTEAGRRAWETQSSTVPIEFRRVLGVVVEETHADEIRARLRRYSGEEVSEMLEELESRGLLESKPMGEDQDLDFTGTFNFSSFNGKKPGS